MQARPAARCHQWLRPNVLLALLAILWVGACRSDASSPTAPSGDRFSKTALASAQGASIDLSGTWSWSETVTTIIPPLIAGIIGIVPEGPVTSATCYDSGTFSLVQTGNTFAGTATQTTACITKGGQQYAAPFPPTLDILDGHIRGQSIDFLFGEGCPYRGTISLSEGVAVQIGGTGKCEIALHPALLKTVSWQATR